MAQRLKKFITRTSVGVMIALLIGCFPVSAYAETADPSDPSQATTTTPADPSQATPPASDPAPVVDPAPAVVPAPVPDPAPAPVQAAVVPQNTQGPSTPPGPSGKTYHKNPDTGMWENDFYIWNPATGKTTPKTAPNYSYNPATGMWDTTQWVYNAPSGKYIPNVVSTTAPPTGSNATINNTGPDSYNNINDGSNSSSNFDNFYNASISNNLSQSAVSGNAGVLFNTTGGSATTGDASNIATLLNLLQSSTNLLGDNFTTFNANITGNVQGDLMLDPSHFNQVQSPDYASNNLTVKSVANGEINNDINLNSLTGNAKVSGNTTGGNATSGNADAVANLVNVINSAVTDGQSFLGVLNIYGNLDGDILLPPDMLNALIAASGPSSTNTASTANNRSLDADLTNNQSIDNNINANATTGQATVAGNTTGGNATSGDAKTNVTLLNLTGHNVVASNAMLVFVNVLGKWVGLIMDAPAGSNAAALAGGATTNCLCNADNVNLDTVNNSRINNNVNVNSTTGDADVTHNTTGGNATTGDATASVNIANIENSNLSLSNWFGILFINVFGSWNGSFGVNTAAGNPTATSQTSGGNGGSGGGVIGFVPKTTSGNSYLPLPMGNVVDSQETSSSSDSENNHAVVLGSTTKKPPVSPAAAAKAQHDWTLLSLGLIMGALLLAAERFISYRNKRRGDQPQVATAATLSVAGSMSEEE